MPQTSIPKIPELKEKFMQGDLIIWLGTVGDIYESYDDMSETNPP
jgi:hypothetical protein